MLFDVIEIGKPRIGWAFMNINDPIVAWSCYRGSIIPAKWNLKLGIPALSLWWARKLNYLDDVMTENEYLLEIVRAKKYPNKVSRLTGFFHFESWAEAQKVGAFGLPYAKSENLVEVGFDPTGRVSKHDANWISYHGSQQSNFNWMHSYWQGLPCLDAPHDPVWEMLTESAGLIYGTDFRERCYKEISTSYPESVLPLLDMARIASEGGHPAGHVAPFLAKDDSKSLMMTFIMRDFLDPAFKEYLKQYTGPRRFGRDFLPQELTTPDLRPYFFSLDYNLSSIEVYCAEKIEKLGV